MVCLAILFLSRHFSAMQWNGSTSISHTTETELKLCSNLWLSRDVRWTCTAIPHLQMDTHTHTRLTAPCPGLPRWAGTRKVPIWILLKQETTSSSGISWAICKSASRSRQITTPAPHHSVFKAGCPSCRPTNSVKKLKATSTNGQRTENATTWNHHYAPDRGTEYRDVCVCLFVCLRAYLWNFLHIRSSPNFLCILPVAVARSSSDSVAICYVFPVLYMTSCLTECSACAALSLAMNGAQ